MKLYYCILCCFLVKYVFLDYYSYINIYDISHYIQKKYYQEIKVKYIVHVYIPGDCAGGIITLIDGVSQYLHIIHKLSQAFLLK